MLPWQELFLELARIHEGALLANESLLFADTAVAFAQARWLGVRLSQLSSARQALADDIRASAEGALSAASEAERSRSLIELGQQMRSHLSSFQSDAGVAVAHALGLEFGLSPTEALQVAAAVGWHLHVGRCANTAFRCLPRRLIALAESGRSMARLLRWRPGPHAAEAAQLALLSAEASGLPEALEAKLAVAAGAMSVFGMMEQDLSLQASTITGEDVPADAARSAWLLGMSTKANRVVDILQSTTETGVALAMRLGRNLVSEVSAFEGGPD